MDQTKNTENGFNTVEEALEDLRQGKLILVTDDPDRENEGDFICAAEYATTENRERSSCMWTNGCHL